MLLDTNIKTLFSITHDLLEDFSTTCHSVDWARDEMTRTGDPLISRTIRIPFGYRKDPYQELTEQVVQVQQAFFNGIYPWLQNKFPNFVFYKGEINYLYPGMILPFHVDACWFHEHGSRIHIPVISNDEAVWITETDSGSMSVGTVYEVNNRVLHSFWNKGTTGRLHIVIDLIQKDVYQSAIDNGIDMNKFTVDPQLTDAAIILKNLGVAQSG